MNRIGDCLRVVGLNGLTFSSKRCFSVVPGSELVVIKKLGRITCIGLNRPEKKNALNYDCARELLNAIEAFEKDESSCAGVIYGERGNLCSGLDVEEVKADPQLPFKIKQVGITEKFCSKPLVAAVNGFALGLGCDLALWCDFRLIEETAVIGGYARKFGFPISVREAERLSYLLGPERALDWVLTGRIVKAKEAFECGAVTRLVACGTAVGQAVNFAKGLVNMPQECLRADRATLLSIGSKFPASTVDLISRVRDEAVEKATQEASSGQYITESGDVRVKTTK